MASYDYRAGKKRIENILDNERVVNEQNRIPTDSEFTFDNGYYGWVSAIFVDIRNSTRLFTGAAKESVSKMIRCFTSEIIEILRNDDNLREIGIRGDCVYAVYTTPQKGDILEMADKAFWINTYMKMLNDLIQSRGYSRISVGIGVSTAQELVVKAGRKDVGINNKVWIGDAVTKAANLSAIGSKNGNHAILFSPCTYNNFIDGLIEQNGDKATEWFTYKSCSGVGYYYDASIIKSTFNDWIENGMP